MRIPEIHRLVETQRTQILGQIVLPGHAGAAHENGNHSHAACERFRNLQTHEVAGHVEAPAPIVGRDRRPPLADDGKQRIALTDLVLDHGLEIVAALDRVEIHVGVVSAEADAEDVEETSRVPAGVFTAIADEHAGHCRGL